MLAPVGEVKNEASLDKAVDIIRSRVDALGVAEPEISRQGIERDHRPARCARPRQGPPPRRQDRGAALPPGARDTSPPETATTTHHDEGRRPRARPPPRRRDLVEHGRDHDDHRAAARSRPRPRPRTRRTRRSSCPAARPTTSRAAPLPARPRRAHREGRERREGAVPRWRPGLGRRPVAARTTARPRSTQLAASRSRSRRRRTRSRSCSTASCSPHRRSRTDASRAATSRSPATSARATPRTSRPSCSTARCRSQLKELTTQSVSPTLGTDQLQAGIAAGIIGLALVALYMLVFYRLLGARRDRSG